MTRWTHRQPGVRQALDEAAAAKLSVKDTPGAHGHSWGYIDCVDLDCAERMRRLYVSSTPRNEHDEVSKIRRFIRKHEHKKESTGAR